MRRMILLSYNILLDLRHFGLQRRSIPFRAYFNGAGPWCSSVGRMEVQAHNKTQPVVKMKQGFTKKSHWELDEHAPS